MAKESAKKKEKPSSHNKKMQQRSAKEQVEDIVEDIKNLFKPNIEINVQFGSNQSKDKDGKDKDSKDKDSKDKDSKEKDSKDKDSKDKDSKDKDSKDKDSKDKDSKDKDSKNEEKQKSLSGSNPGITINVEIGTKKETKDQILSKGAAGAKDQVASKGAAGAKNQVASKGSTAAKTGVGSKDRAAVQSKSESKNKATTSPAPRKEEPKKKAAKAAKPSKPATTKKPEKPQKPQKKEVKKAAPKKKAAAKQKKPMQKKVSSTKKTEYPFKDMVSSYEFVVSIGSKEIKFSKISNLSNHIEVDAAVGYGTKPDIHFSRSQDQELQTLHLEKGMIKADLDKNSLVYNLTEGVIVNNLNISVRQSGKEVTSFMVEKGIVVNCRYSDLDARDGTILVKEIEIKHGGLTYK